MKVTYTGFQTELSPAQEKKLTAKFSKLAKLLERKGESSAHVILTAERHMQRAEITVHFHNHSLVGVATGGDPFTAITGSIEKLEKQALKLRKKWGDAKRVSKTEWEEEVLLKAESGSPESESDLDTQESKVFRVSRHDQHKPMTLEEALMTIRRDQDYLVFRDADTDRISVLLRRRDGNFDLIEA
jgi:putative sigma-54 modulation protein